MNEKAITQVIEALKPLAEKLEMGAGKLWEIMMRQNYVKAVIDVTEILFSLAIVGVIVWWIKFYVKKSQDGNSTSWDLDELPFFASCVVGVILFVLFAIIALESAGVLLTRLANPEYAVIQDIINLAK